MILQTRNNITNVCEHFVKLFQVDYDCFLKQPFNLSVILVLENKSGSLKLSMYDNSSELGHRVSSELRLVSFG